MFRETEEAAIQLIATGMIRARVVTGWYRDAFGKNVGSWSIIEPLPEKIRIPPPMRAPVRIAFSAISIVGLALSDQTRQCLECGRFLPYDPCSAWTANYWHRDAKMRGGYKRVCRECRNARQARTILQ